MTLTIKSLTYAHADEPLLSKLSFSLQPGELLHIQGANGTGKTTLLRLLAGILPSPVQTIFWQGRPIDDDLVDFQRNLCYVGHKSGLSLALTVRENCYFDLHSEVSFEALDELLADFNLLSLSEEPCFRLSEGQRRRVGLMRLFMTKACLWLLDEPLVALDNLSLQRLIAQLNKHLTRGGLIILSSHQALPDTLMSKSCYPL